MIIQNCWDDEPLCFLYSAGSTNSWSQFVSRCQPMVTFSHLLCADPVISPISFKLVFAAHLQLDYFLYSLHLLLPSFLSSTSLTNFIFLLPFFLTCPLLSYHLSPLSIRLPPLLCDPDLLSLCQITKSTGSSRRSCRRSSPSVRSSLTRVRGTAWHGKCVCVCVNATD